MFLSHLNLLASAPGGVTRLRELILTLAVQGKLVPQDPKDEPACELLKKIRAEKTRLIAEGKIKRDKPLAELRDDEKPFELPKGWEWVRLPEIYYSISPSGSKLLSSAVQPEGKHPVVDQGQRHIAGYTNDDSLLIEVPWPVIIFGDHTKEIKYIDFDFVAGADGTKILRPVQQDERFFAWQLRSFPLEDRGYARHFKVLNSCLFALPPLAEQSRIVTRVEELMRLCDALEAKGQLETRQHAQLVSTLLDTLTQSETPGQLTENWQCIATHFDLLLDRPEAVDALEQTILQLAVRGLLVPQEPQDEPASELLKKIRLEKDRLIAEGKIKRDKPLSPISENEQPFTLPMGWSWARFPELGDFGRGKSKHRPRNDPALFNPPKYPLIQTGEVSRAKGIVQEVHSYYSDIGLAQSRMWPKGTLCITIAANIAESAVLGFDSCFPDSVVGFVPANTMGNVEYFLLFVETARADLLAFAPATAQKNINLEILSSLLIPVPPLNELTRIVTRVESLRRLCFDLRQRLTASQSTQAHLAEALVQGV